jgi:hypothetical protein
MEIREGWGYARAWRVEMVQQGLEAYEDGVTSKELLELSLSKPFIVVETRWRREATRMSAIITWSAPKPRGSASQW